MMTFKLAIANIRKSFQDYSIYYLTIIFSAALFYAFNSLGVQTEGLDLPSQNALEAISNVMYYVTIFLSFIFGFLLVYANNYLIRRRKKELGIYQLLGMKKTQIAHILTLEIFLSSLVSMAIGILLGVFLSHFLFFVTASLMQTKINNFHFMFSLNAMLFTMGCFALMFVVVLVFTLFSVTRVKLIDLFQAHRKNEDVKLRNPYIAGIIFIVAVGIIAWACHRLSVHQYNEFLRMAVLGAPKEFGITTLLLVVGTVLLFYSFAAAYLIFSKARKKSYYNDLNMFSVRQISSHFTNATASMVVLSLLLFFTLSTLTSSLGFNGYFRWMEKNVHPYDAYFASSPHMVREGEFDVYAPGGKSLKDYLDERGLGDVDTVKDVLSVQVFYPESIGLTIDNLRLVDLLEKEGHTAQKLKSDLNISDEGFEEFRYQPLNVVPYSTYVKACKFAHVEPVAIDDNQYLLASNIYTDLFDFAAKSKLPITVKGHKLVPAADSSFKAVEASLLSTEFYSNINEGVLIVPDAYVDAKSKIRAQSVMITFKDGVDKDQAAVALSQLPVTDENGSDEDIAWTQSLVFLNVADYARSLFSSKLIIIYISFYLGFVMTMTVATILSIQQLSSALDSRGSYDILRRIGVSESLCKKSLLRQVLFYYLMPLVVGGFYAFFAMYILKLNTKEIIPMIFGSIEICTLGGFVLIYLLYMLVTYQMSKRIIFQK